MKLPFTVIRTIHPVGQGAFYTEKFYNRGEDNAEHTVVFDCGSKTKIGGAKKVCIERIVNNSLDSNQHIDILFISHFDIDHVNGIGYLLDRGRKIDYVVLPQIDSYQWFYIVEDVCSSNNDAREASSLVFDLRRRLEKNGIKVLQVKPIEEEPRLIPNDDEFPANEDSTQNNIRQPEIDSISGIYDKSLSDNGSYINSGVPFSMGIQWVYIPSNFTYERNIDDLKCKIDDILSKDRKFDDATSISELNSEELVDFIHRNRKAINDVYDKVFPDTNASSLCVYSGVADTKLKSISYPYWFTYEHCLHYFYDYGFGNREGCLYTGDSVMTKGQNMLKVDFVLNSILHWRSRLVTIQLPHHGSKNNFGGDSFAKLEAALTFSRNKKLHPLLFFASFGDHNSYGHPSDSLIDFLVSKERVYYHGVSEAKSTVLRQRIMVR